MFGISEMVTSYDVELSGGWWRRKAGKGGVGGTG